MTDFQLSSSKFTNRAAVAAALRHAADILAAPLEFPADDEAADKPEGESQAEEDRA